MDRSLWLFVLSESEGPVPQPWERCYDVTDEILYYKNLRSNTVVFDLRSRVKVGTSFVHINGKRKVITGRLSELIINEKTHVIVLLKCCGPQSFFIIPELVQRCPVCHIPVIYVPCFD